jgi:hypothetical protein
MSVPPKTLERSPKGQIQKVEEPKKRPFIVSTGVKSRADLHTRNNNNAVLLSQASS